jgi:hypothetical protein
MSNVDIAPALEIRIAPMPPKVNRQIAARF